jgi:murein DD-endopeptidase MepM/ murein hydrolase activator NlpD
MSWLRYSTDRSQQRLRLPLILMILLWLLMAIVPAAQAQEDGVHIVAAGETLSGISERYGIPIERLMAANDLSNPDLIVVGQRLILPGQPSLPELAPAHDLVTYQMQPGETLSVLARRLGVDPQALLAANGITRRNYLFLAPELVVPAPRPSSLPAPFRTLSHSRAVVQGHTGVVHVTLDVEATPEGVYGRQPLLFNFREKTAEGYRYWALLPTTAITPEGDTLLRLRVHETELELNIPTLPGDYITQNIRLSPTTTALLEPRRVRNELEVLREVWTAISDTQQWRRKFIMPIADGFRRTSPYGSRRSYNDGPVSSFHEGADWGAPEGTPVWAPEHGAVVLAEMLDVRGGAVVIDHGLGVTSNFWHLSRILVEPGQQVTPGEVIGLVGTTGLSTGAHLHWEIRVNGVAVEPLQWTEVHFPFAPMVSAR